MPSIEGSSPPAHRVRDQRTGADRGADEPLGADSGLSDREAQARLEHYGPNALEEKRRRVLLEFLSHFWPPIPWMIEAAVVLTAVTGISGSSSRCCSSTGFWEEHQVANAIEALKQRLAKQARVPSGVGRMVRGGILSILDVIVASRDVALVRVAGRQHSDPCSGSRDCHAR